MNFLNECFNTMLEYGEAVKNSFVKGHVSDWPEEKEEIVSPEAEPATNEPVEEPEEDHVDEPVEEPVEGTVEE